MTSANEIDFNLDGNAAPRRAAKPPRRPKAEMAGLEVRNNHLYVNGEQVPDDASFTTTAGHYARIVSMSEQLASGIKLKLEQDAGLENVKMILRNGDGRVIGMVERKVPREALVGAIETTIHATRRP
jgi:hypothetical protein